MSENRESAAIIAECQLAVKARRSGQEGRARVHARRAAGWAVGLSFRRGGQDPGTRNALRLLVRLSVDPAAAESLRQAARRLTVHVTPDHTLPHGQDPLHDADVIIGGCLPELAGGLMEDLRD